MLKINFISLFFCLFVLLRYIKCSSMNNSAMLISRYSKVAHWGQVRTSSTEETPIYQARSSSGQSLWTHRSDANVISGQNIKSYKNNGVVYHYAISKKQPSSKLGINKNEKLPAVGEVQERFNPKPYFDYASVPSKQSNRPSSNKRPADVSFSPPSPVYKKPPVIQNDLPDAYNSPFNSYNPAPVAQQDTKNSDPIYPPIDNPGDEDPQLPPPEPTGYSYTSPKSNSNNGYDYKPAKKPKLPNGDSEGPAKPYASFGPPLAPSDDMDDNHGTKDHSLFYPPSGPHGNHEVILDHPPPGYEDDNQDSSDSMGPPPMNMNHNGDNGEGDLSPPPAMNMNHNGDNGEDDLSPPPSDANGKFPHYLYNGYDNGHSIGAYDLDHHHVYEEVEPPTTTQAPEDERVNKGHYSYYYLGRKLWYIPLYFSVYFIIYVTILILKSIARHKIQIKHELHDKFRQSRQMDLNEKIDNLHKNVTDAISFVNRTYIM